jgi:hypothetical protein
MRSLSSITGRFIGLLSNRFPSAFFLLVLMAVLVAGSASRESKGQTIHQLFNSNASGTNALGIRYIGGSDGIQGPPFNSLGTDGRFLLLFDKSEYLRRLYTLGMPAGLQQSLDNEIRLPFVGSGIDIHQLNRTVGEVFDWEVVSSGSNDSYSVVASGTSSTDTSGPLAVQVVNAVPQGTLPTDRIHMLRLRIKDSDGLDAVQGGNWSVMLDAVGIYDNVPLNFDDDSNLSGNWTFSSGWQTTFDGFAYEGQRSATNLAGETININFTGTGIAVLGFGSNSGSLGGVWGTGPSDSGTYSWSIDGGAGGSGVIDQSLDHFWAERWPELVVNGLSAGPHTLTITSDGPSGAALGDYSNNGTNDAADYTVWRDNLGATMALPNENPAAVTPGVVDQEDFDYWSANFGSTGTTARFSPHGGFTQIDAIAVFNPSPPITSAVPEPSTVCLAMLGLFAACCKRLNRARVQA